MTEDDTALAIGRTVLRLMREFVRIEGSNTPGISPGYCAVTYDRVPVDGVDALEWQILVRRPEE